MIRAARGSLLFNVHSPRGARLQQQAVSSASSAFVREYPSFSVSFSVKTPSSLSIGFQGFLSAFDRENKNFARRSFHCCPRHGLKHTSILALWSFEIRSPYCYDASRLRKPEALHTSTRGKLTTSELIIRLKLAKSTGSQSAISSKALETDSCFIQENPLVVEEKVHGSTGELTLTESMPSPDKVTSDVATEKKPLSQFIPQHVVAKGFMKRESFFKNGNLQSNGSEILQRNRQRGPNQLQNIPVLGLSSNRKDAPDESRTINARRNDIQELASHRFCAPKVPQMSSAGRNVAAEGFVKRRGLLAAGFEIVSSSKGFGETTEVPSKQHVQESFFKHKNLQGIGRETLRRSRQSQQQNIPMLKVLNTEKNTADEPGTSKATRNRIQEKVSDCWCAPQVVQMSSAGRNAAAEGIVKSGGLLAPGSEIVSSSNEAGEGDLFAQNGESAGMPSKCHVQGIEELRDQQAQNRENVMKQSQEFSESALRTKESRDVTGRLRFAGKGSAETLFQQHTGRERVPGDQHFVEGKFAEKESERSQEDRTLFGMSSTKTQFQCHRESTESVGESGAERQLAQHGKSAEVVSTKSAGENGEIVGKEPFYMKLSRSAQFQRPIEGVEFLTRQPFDRRQDSVMQFQAHRKSHPSDRASEVLLPEEGGPAAARKPFDRNRPRRKCKNELNEKDLSVQPIAGEPHYEYLIRRKRVRAEAQKALVDDVDDYKHVGDDWVRKRIGWLCKELPVLKASGLVKMLNKQRQWIKQEHLKELIEHLVRYMELNRAHRVLKWMQQQPFYEFEYEFHNNMAYILGRNDKLSRCQDVFDEIVRNGKFPDSSVFTALIKAYLHKGDQGDINDAWKYYNQMLQLGLTISSSLSETLLKSLTCPTGRWIRQVEELLVKMRASGLYINEEMYSRVMNIYGKRGDHKKLDALIDEIKKEQLEIDIDMMNARLAACVKDVDTKRGEHTFREIIELGLKPNWYSYAHLIQLYGKSNLPIQAWEVFEKMKGEKIPVNFVTYHAIIDAMAADGLHVEQVLQVLTEVENSGIKPLQPCYNSIMNMFLKLKRHCEVEAIFYRGKARKVRPAHAAYNMLLKSYTDSGQLEKAEAVFQEMKVTEGTGPNTHTYNILLEGYGVACFKGKVKELFEEMSAKGCQLDPDVKAKIQSMIGVKKIVELEKKKLVLTDEQREIIPGLLLGGAKMESPDRKRTYELHLEFNCENQVTKVVKDHLSFLFQAWWKENQLGASGSPVEASDMNSRMRLETVSHGSFRFYAHQYRPNGEPVIPKLIHRWLKPRTLAYWYMYGGRKCRTSGGIVLNASKYSGKQIQLVVKALKARTMDCRRKKKRNGDVIRFEGKSAVWLWKLMEPYILKAVREQLKPEVVPVNLALANGTESWSSDDRPSSDDDDDWDDLEAEKDEAVESILQVV